MASLKTAHSRSKLRALAAELLERKQRGAGAVLDQKQVLLHPLLDEQDILGDPEEHISLRHYELASQAISRQISHDRPWYGIDPDGFPRRIWDSIAAILIYSLIFYLPFLSAYFDDDCCAYLTFANPTCKPNVGVPGHPTHKGWQIFVILTNWFFIFDIMLNFLTGYVDGAGVVHYNIRTIAVQYISDWMWLDLLASFPLECCLWAVHNVNFYNFPKFMRLFRAFGLRRRCRGNPFRWVDKLSNVRKEFSYSAQRLVVAAFITMTALHYFACLIWLTIRWQHFPAVTWPQQQDLLVGVSVMEQYLWSLFNLVSAMIGLGYGAFPPRTWPEALVWCIAMVTVASLFAVINGFIVATILSSARGRHRYKERMDNVMAALKARRLPPDLYKRLLDYFIFRYQHAQVADDRDLWTELPYDLQAALALASTEPLLRQIPLFADEVPLLERVAMLLKPAYALAGEEVMRQGWPANQVYFIRSGYVDLIMNKKVVDTLHDGDFFGEAALMELPSEEDLMEHCGASQAEVSHYTDMFTTVTTVHALTNCEMYVLEHDDFRECVQDFPGICRQLEAAASRHAERLKRFKIKLGPPRGTRTPQPTGSVDDTTIDELLAGLSDTSLSRKRSVTPRPSMLAARFGDGSSPDNSIPHGSHDGKDSLPHRRKTEDLFNVIERESPDAQIPPARTSPPDAPQDKAD
ncbi:hypothetical protein WJX73_005550 [Symbiochloris irregularis]|uniref:Cyclic nucleotide-binding domain-containing protein n=1 Tax=Symbiochloris irregularis TaxID=706552 RepID=A0AAW1NIT8_9CHLO